MTRTRRAARARPPGVVALGASAGGLESLGRLLEGLPEGFPAPILVALHLDPHHRSQAVPLLQRRTRLRVEAARPGVHAEAGVVYVAPPDHHLELQAGKLRLTHAPRVNHARPSIDLLFASIAADAGPAAVVAVLSGAGSDGAAGVAAVKARGGVAVAEDAATAAFPAMPEAAGRTGLLDAVLPIGQIPAFLLRVLVRRVAVSERQWTRMLALLEERTGARFSHYRSTTLHRRLQHRLAATGCRTMAAYLRLLERDGAELDRLQAAFLIKVSSFLRDPSAWRALAREIAPLAARRPRVRAWSAGCATGDEAYSLALLLARALGVGRDARWKVFATDLDDGALRVARAARYSAEQVRGVPKADLARHFERAGDSWRVGRALRSRVVFGRHDLLRDPPLSGMDVLACRNVLIYFTPAQKQRTLRRLAAAVDPGGILFLGRSEAGPVPGFDRLGHTTLFRRGGLAGPVPTRKRGPAAGLEGPAAARDGPLGDSRLVVAVAVDAKGRVVAWNRAARDLFGKAAGQALGKTLGRAVGARTARQLQATLRERGTGHTLPVRCDGPGGQRWLDVECVAAEPPATALFLGTAAPLAEPRPQARPAARGRARHATAEARFQAQQDLNEELQSRNEELETVNEELQSLNDELSAMEEQMRSLAETSRRANDFLRHLLDTASKAFIACDADNRILFWNKAAVKRFRLSSAQAVGGKLFDLVPALDQAPLRAAARKVRQPGRNGHVTVARGGVEYMFDPLPSEPGSGRNYLLRVRSTP